MTYTHTHIHAEFVPGCFGCKVLSINVSAHATPNRANLGTVVDADARQARWDKDHAAYRRLVRNGLQPKTLDGSAELEARGADKLEIQMGHLFPDKEARKKAVDAMTQAQELGDA